MRKLLIAIVMLMFISCTDKDGATAFLMEQGYTNIQITGFDFFAKGKDDWSSTGFVATGPTGKTVRGAVTDKGPLAFFRPRWNLRIWSTK